MCAARLLELVPVNPAVAVQVGGAEHRLDIAVGHLAAAVTDYTGLASNIGELGKLALTSIVIILFGHGQGKLFKSQPFLSPSKLFITCVRTYFLVFDVIDKP